MLKSSDAKAIMNVDKFIGSDYEYVKSVSNRIETINYLNDDLDKLLYIYDNLTVLKKIFDEKLNYDELNNSNSSLTSSENIPNKKYSYRPYIQGSAYNTVHHVARNLSKIKRINYYLEEIKILEESLDWLEALSKIIKDKDI